MIVLYYGNLQESQTCFVRRIDVPNKCGINKYYFYVISFAFIGGLNHPDKERCNMFGSFCGFHFLILQVFVNLTSDKENASLYV